MSRLHIEKVDNGYVVKIMYPKDRRTLVHNLDSKNHILELVKKYLDEEL